MMTSKITYGGEFIGFGDVKPLQPLMTESGRGFLESLREKIIESFGVPSSLLEGVASISSTLEYNAEAFAKIVKKFSESYSLRITSAIRDVVFEAFKVKRRNRKIFVKLLKPKRFDRRPRHQRSLPINSHKRKRAACTNPAKSI